MRFFFYLIGIAGIISCNQQEPVSSEINNTGDSIVTVPTTSYQDSVKQEPDTAFVEKYETDSETDRQKNIEATFGKQWDFCDCIVKNDSIQKAIDSAGDISDEAFDKLMTRFEEIDKHCKSVISSPNTTPEQRKAHKRRVRKCLGKK